MVCYGDPLFWLALTRTGILSDVSEKGLFYLEELEHFWGVSNFERIIIEFYSLLHTLNFIEFAKANSDLSHQVRLKSWLDKTLISLENRL